MPARKPKPKAVKKANVADEKWRAFELRKNGWSLRAIGEELGVSYETIRRHLNEVLEVLAQETLDEAKEYRSIQVNRLMDILHTHRPIANDATNDDYQKATELVLKTEAMLMKLMGTEELPIQRIEQTGGDGTFKIEYVGADEPVSLPKSTTQEESK